MSVCLSRAHDDVFGPDSLRRGVSRTSIRHRLTEHLIFNQLISQQMSCIVSIVEDRRERYDSWGNGWVSNRMESSSEMQSRPVAVASPRANRLRAVNVSRKNRSAASNRSTILAGVDGRSLEARRFRDLCVSYSDPLGGFESLSEDDAAIVRQAAGVTLQSESMQASIVRGEAVDAEQVVRLTNVLTRLLASIKKRHPPKRVLTLAERLAGGE
jgi:hypothetical protein